ncbi:hypothetical protein DL770_010637 [Monosporascus sp. CRB-9-2]|nr:hypothetical protein DL770_010637 [Monosporascus sp. CRB-9-2]
MVRLQPESSEEDPDQTIYGDPLPSSEDEGEFDQAIYGPPLSSTEDGDESMNDDGDESADNDGDEPMNDDSDESANNDGDESMNNDSDANPSTHRRRVGRPPKHPMGYDGNEGKGGRPRKYPVSEPRTPPPPERRRAPKQKYVASPSSRQTRTATNTAPPVAMGASYRLRRPKRPNGAADKPNKVPGRGRGRPRKSDNTADTANRPNKAASRGGRRGRGGRKGAKSASRRKSPSPSPSDREESRPDDGSTSSGTSLDSIFQDLDLEASTSGQRRPKSRSKNYGSRHKSKRHKTAPAGDEAMPDLADADDDYSILPPDPGEDDLDALLSSAARPKGKEKLRKDEPRQPSSAKRPRPKDAAEAHEEDEARPRKKQIAEGQPRFPDHLIAAWEAFDPSGHIPHGEALFEADRKGFWSEDDERKHQAEKAGDIPGLASDITDEARDVIAEQSMWKIFGALFNAIPRELFTWGLRPHESAYTDDGSLYLDRAFSRELEYLMSHPIWKGDKTELRYVLQTAVFLRVADHTPVMGPVGAAMTNIAAMMPGERDDGTSNEREGKVAYELYKAFGPGTRKHLQPLLENMKRLVLKKPVANEMERQLFLLQTHDVRQVRRALDTSLVADGVPWPMSTQEFHAEFRRASSEVYDRISPESLKKLADLKAAVEIADSRDEKIRANILRANLGRDIFLHDRPDFGAGSEASYPCRYYHHPDVGPIAGLVIKGLVPDPKRVRLFGPPAWQLVAAEWEAKGAGFPPAFRTAPSLKTLLPPQTPAVVEYRNDALFPSSRDVEVDPFLEHEEAALTNIGFYWGVNRDVIPEKSKRQENTEFVK